MQQLNEALQKMCGISSIPYKGALGHKYYVNDLAQIIAQEMANPKVRPHLDFYPEDAGEILEEARQADRWLTEISNDELTPMARIRGNDFFVHEPAMLRGADIDRCCIPVRWFNRDGALFAKCWEMKVVNLESGSMWRVIQHDNYKVAANQFLKNFPELKKDAVSIYNLPDPSHILDVIDPKSGRASAWTFTDPEQGNRWRAKAKGRRVVTFAMWMYCDDTSGNVSKKWNEHNSFLFTPASLPRSEAQKEYNVHFLSTSNLAPPLEMMDGVVDQLEKAQEDGIWAWDCIYNESVLVIPMVLALLGDNPMQSEFACHIGLRGKFFCRVCKVKGADGKKKKKAGEDGERSDGGGGDSEDECDDAASDDSAAGSAHSEATSAASNVSGKSKSKTRKALESAEKMTARIKAFINIGEVRTKEETVEILRSFFTNTKTLNTSTKVKAMRTQTGVKDTFQLHFLNKLWDSYKKLRGTQKKQDALDAMLADLPDCITSPVWRIRGLDPHRDTPIEILHVILLGFVKYLWRDAIQNQLNKKDAKKALLQTRLSSLDVSGLGISPLAGRTLVQYAGSLTGRDFRAIAQVAPFVLYDLVPKDCLETWVALSKLIPLIWQPDIRDLKAHITLLQTEIRHFLLCAARWTNRWFNKPKFHMLVHLPDHIRRFGPAILFATEAFESFNAVIRAKSVHSNRHAPSRDIARTFAQGNRMRHLLSGGHFVRKDLGAESGESSGVCSTTTSSEMVPVGPGPLSLVSSPSTVTQYLGFKDNKRSNHSGACVRDELPQRPFIQTLTGTNLPRTPKLTQQAKATGMFQTAKEIYLHNGDKCEVNGHVIMRKPGNMGQTYIGKVVEILQAVGSPASFSQVPDVVLVQTASIDQISASMPYRMPRIALLHEFSTPETVDILCTVNAQHDCAANKCSDTGRRTVFQERNKTEHTRPVVEHLRNPGDVVLNTAQMRDAVHLQKFRIPSEILDADDILNQSVNNEITARKVKEKADRAAGISANQNNPRPSPVQPSALPAPAPAPTRPVPRPVPRRITELRPGEGVFRINQ